MANIVSLTAILETNSAGAIDGQVFVPDQSGANLIFQIPTVASVGGPINIGALLAPSASVGIAFNVLATIPSDYSFPAVGSSMSVSYYPFAPAGSSGIARDNWTRVR